MLDEQVKDLAVAEKTVMLIGDEDDLATVTDRLMMLHPEAKKVGLVGMRQVAQLAILTGANPLPTAGEVWIWSDRGQIVVDIGIAYYRRMARRNDEVFWVEEPRPMTPEEREKHRVPAEALASICTGYVGSKMRRLVEMGAPWTTAEKRVARTSIGVVDQFEMIRKSGGKYWKAGDAIAPPKGRTWQWVCDKRAEKGFYRMEALIDTTFVDRLEQVQRMVTEMGGGPPHRTISQEEVDDLNEELFGNGPVHRPDVIEAAVEMVEDEPEEQDNDPLVAMLTAESGGEWARLAYELPYVRNAFEAPKRVLDWRQYVAGDGYDPESNVQLAQILRDYCNAVADGATVKVAAQRALDAYRPLFGGDEEE